MKSSLKQCTKQLLQFHSKTTHMNQLNCIIIDDEEGAHRVLEHFISQLKQLKLNGSFIRCRSDGISV
jgi:transposase-like protein